MTLILSNSEVTVYCSLKKVGGGLHSHYTKSRVSVCVCSDSDQMTRTGLDLCGWWHDLPHDLCQTGVCLKIHGFECVRT